MTQKMYIGPTVPGVVEKNRIFTDKLPEQVQKLKEENISFSRLIVPVDQLIAARTELHTKGSVLAVCYSKVEKGLWKDYGQKGRENGRI